jgi:hypothetical protein
VGRIHPPNEEQDVDVISWAVALVAGLALPSLRRAVALGIATSITIRVYQYAFTDPRQWGSFPEDLFGAAAMLVLTAILAWVGSMIRQRVRSEEVVR